MIKTRSIRIPEDLYEEIKHIAENRSKRVGGLKISVPEMLKMIVKEHKGE
jgi:predicted DNA-binding protein